MVVMRMMMTMVVMMMMKDTDSLMKRWLSCDDDVDGDNDNDNDYHDDDHDDDHDGHDGHDDDDYDNDDDDDDDDAKTVLNTQVSLSLFLHLHASTGFCIHHGKHIEDPTSSLPVEICRVAETMFDELAESIIQYAQYVHGLYDIDAPRRNRTNDPSTAILVGRSISW
jgi:ABC-type Zn2+ transport system substrate-binding protein/surface adhesin